jgi:stage II sporulation protein D
MKKIASVLFLLLIAAEVYPSAGGPEIIRVRLDSGKKKILLRVKGAYRIEAINADLVLDEARRLRGAYVTPTRSGIKLGGKEFKVYGIRVVPKRDATIYVDRNRLSGTLDIIRSEDLKLLIVNNLDIEKYLYGVLAREVPHYWPTELLKAQAIAARTFVLYRKRLARAKDYDVTSDIYSQVYGGISSERWRATKAVDATRGRVLTYRGEIIPAYYHAICAGHTGDAKTIFETDLTPLRGRWCPFCNRARGFNWKAMFSYRQMEKRLNKYGIKLRGLSYIVVGKRDRSGRVETLKVKDKEGVKAIKGYKFRLALGPNMIRSTNFTIKITPKGIIFRGKGWGHGVGMCQWGAFDMAKRRFDYKRILEYYYPGAKIQNKDVVTPNGPVSCM